MADVGRAKVGGGARLAYEVHGPADGRPVVLVHAGIADRHMHDRLLPALPADVRAVAYDQRGFGNTTWRRRPWSPADDLLRLLDALGMPRATVVGSSFGAHVAVEAALAAPERVTGLVLLAPPLPEPEAWSPAMAAYQEADEAALAEGRFDDSVELDLRTWVDGPDRTPEQSDPAIREGVERALRHALAAQRRNPLGAERLPDPPAQERLGELRTETVIAVGELDQPDFRVMAARLVGRLPSATLHRVGGAGHLLALERPDVVARLVAGVA